jgi:hypothetical protein
MHFSNEKNVFMKHNAPVLARWLSWSNFKVKRSKIKAPMESSFHKEHIHTIYG